MNVGLHGLRTGGLLPAKAEFWHTCHQTLRLHSAMARNESGFLWDIVACPSAPHRDLSNQLLLLCSHPSVSSVAGRKVEDTRITVLLFCDDLIQDQTLRPGAKPETMRAEHP